MRMRLKFGLITLLVFMGFLFVIVLNFVILARIESITEVARTSDRLLDEVRRLRNRVKETMIAAFSPGIYGSLKDVVYFDPPVSLVRNLRSESEGFFSRLSGFLESAPLQRLVRQGMLQNEYETALIMKDKAASRLREFCEGMELLRERDLFGDPTLYATIQSSTDPRLIRIFSTARETSYYLVNSFEGYLGYFTEALEEEALRSKYVLRASLLAFSFLSVLLTTVVLTVFSRRIVGRLRDVESAIRDLAGGRLSVSLDFRSGDEFEDLAANFRRYAGLFEQNIRRMVEVVREVATEAVAYENMITAYEPDKLKGLLSYVHRVLVEYITREESVDAAGIALPGKNGCTWSVYEGDPSLRDEVGGLLGSMETEPPHGGILLDARAGIHLLVGHVGIGERSFGLLVLVARREFSDLERIRFENFLELGALTIDNALKYQELLERKHMEYETLQSQISPHFLFNVLTCLLALNRMKEHVAVEQAIFSLKGLLRYTIESKAVVPLRDELGFIEDYLRLQQLRFGERLSWEILFPREADGFPFPKLLLQPLVENAVVHGLEDVSEGGHIWIRVTVGGGFLHITVEDDGRGFHMKTMKEGVGLTNVRRRLDLLFQHARLEISSSPGKGTVSVVSIPLKELKRIHAHTHR